MGAPRNLYFAQYLCEKLFGRSTAFKAEAQKNDTPRQFSVSPFRSSSPEHMWLLNYGSRARNHVVHSNSTRPPASSARPFRAGSRLPRTTVALGPSVRKCPSAVTSLSSFSVSHHGGFELCLGFKTEKTNSRDTRFSQL